MKARLWPVALLLVGGCATPEQVTVPEAETKVTTIAFEPRVEEAEELKIFNGDDALVLGTTRAEALSVFEQPKEARAFSTLPQNFGKDFSSIGWEEGDLSFACIAYQPTSGPEETAQEPEKIVLAMYTQSNADDATIARTVAKYTEAFGQPTTVIPGRQVQYWFWIRSARWLMVNTSVDPEGKQFVTVALGAPQAMRELRMAPDLAREDQRLAIERLSNGEE